MLTPEEKEEIARKAKETAAELVASAPGAVIPEKREEKRERDPRFFSKYLADLLSVREGRKPENGTDFDALERQREEFCKRTGVAVGAGSSAGNFVPTEYSQNWANLIYSESPVLSRCQRIPMSTDQIVIPTLTGGITVSWVPEVTNTSSMASQATGLKPEATPTTSQATLTRYAAVCRVLVTRKALRTTSPAIDAVINQNVPPAIMAECEAALLAGGAVAATDPITGLDTLITTNAKTWNVANPIRGLADFIMAPEEHLGAIAAPDTIVAGIGAIKILMALQDGQNRPYFNFPNADGRPASIGGVPVIKSANVPSTYGGGTDSRMYVGNFGRHCLVGSSEGMFVQVNPYAYAKENLVEFLFETYFGFTVSDEGAFAYMNVPTA
jgi:HK97 family phage major capsid protein